MIENGSDLVYTSGNGMLKSLQRKNKPKTGKKSKNGGGNRNGSPAIRLSPGLKSPTRRKWLRQLAQGWELISDAISVSDPKSNELLYINPAWRQLYGFTFKEALGESAVMLNPGGLPNKKQATILAQTRKGGWQGRLMNQDAKGNMFAVNLNTQPLHDDEGKLRGLLGVATPVRRHNVSDEKIRQLVEQHQIVLSRELQKLVETALINNEPLAPSNGNANGSGKSKTEDVLGLSRLSERELEIFTHIGRGLGTRDIGKKLGVSAYTVQTHRNHIKDKLNLPDSAAITYWAFQWVNGQKS
jgi:PAS domain S-box-containing protein